MKILFILFMMSSTHGIYQIQPYTTQEKCEEAREVIRKASNHLSDNRFKCVAMPVDMAFTQ